MRKILSLFIALLFFNGLLQAKEIKTDNPKEKAKTKLLFFELKSISGFEKDKARVLENVILAELYKYKDYEVISKSDLEKILSAEEFKQLIDCSDNQCLIEVSGALGSPNLVSGEIGLLARDTGVLTLQVLDNQTAKTKSRVYKNLRLSEPETTLAGIRASVKELVEGLKGDLKIDSLSIKAQNYHLIELKKLSSKSKPNSEILVLPFFNRGIEKTTAINFSELLYSGIQSHKTVDFDPNDIPCKTKECGKQRGIAGSYKKVVFGSLLKMGEKIIINTSVHNQESPLETFKYKVNTQSDLDLAADRIAKKVAIGKSLEDEELGSVTTLEEKKPRRKKGQEGLGLTLGAFFPLKDGYSGGNKTGAEIGLLFSFETLYFMIEPSVSIRFDISDEKKYFEIPLNIGGSYLFSKGNFAPFIGLGGGLRYIKDERLRTVSTGEIIPISITKNISDKAFGFGFYGKVGLLMLRVYERQLLSVFEYNFTKASVNEVSQHQSLSFNLGVKF